MSPFCCKTSMSLILACSLSTGCAQSHCADPARQNDPDCQASADQGTVSAFLVAPLRIPIDASSSISVGAGGAWANKSLSIQQAGGGSYKLGVLDQDGNLAIPLTATMLRSAGLKPGPVNFVIEGNAKTVAARIYLSPKIDSMPAMTRTRSVIPDCTGSGCIAYSSSLGVFAKSILSVNYYSFLGKNSLDLIAYKFDGSNLNRQNALIVNALRFGDQPIGVAVTDASFFAADYNNLTARLWGCTDSANVSSCDISGFAVSPLSSIVSLSANLHDATKLYAGIFNGVIGVHSQSNLSGANIYQTATNDPNLGQLATMLAVGELNGDANPDLVVWYPNGSLSVYTGSPGPGLQFSPIYSTKLQATQSGMGVRPVAAAVGDIDGDGLDDIVVAGGLLISVLTNQGDSTFKVAQTITTSSAVTALAIGDVSPIGQGVSDLVIGSQSANTITVLENLAKY